jgi:uncharacterized membrane protein YczE
VPDDASPRREREGTGLAAEQPAVYWAVVFVAFVVVCLFLGAPLGAGVGVRSVVSALVIGVGVATWQLIRARRPPAD